MHAVAADDHEVARLAPAAVGRPAAEALPRRRGVVLDLRDRGEVRVDLRDARGLQARSSTSSRTTARSAARCPCRRSGPGRCGSRPCAVVAVRVRRLLGVADARFRCSSAFCRAPPARALGLALKPLPRLVDQLDARASIAYSPACGSPSGCSAYASVEVSTPLSRSFSLLALHAGDAGLADVAAERCRARGLRLRLVVRPPLATAPRPPRDNPPLPGLAVGPVRATDAALPGVPGAYSGRGSPIRPPAARRVGAR